MDRAAARAVEVELVEDDPGTSDAPDAGTRRPLLARLPRGSRWVAVALAASVVVGVSVAQRLDSAAVDARLDGVDGLSASLDRPLTEVWRVSGTGILGVVDGTVVALGADGDSTVAVDALTGLVRWTRDGACQMVTVGEPPATRPRNTVGFPDRPDDLVVCLETVPGAGEDGSSRPLSAHVLRPATGDVLRRVDVGALDSLETVGSDLLGVGIAADSHAEAARWSLLTGERRWSYRSPDVLPPTDSWGSSIDRSVVQLDIGPWSLALDADTGERIPRARPRAAGGRVVQEAVPLGGVGTASSRFEPGGLVTTTVRAADGSASATFPGLLVRPLVDDGSVPDRVFVVRGDRPGDPPGIVGVDPATGESRWRGAARVGRTAVVQGLLLVDDDAGVTALDALTGARRWSAPTEAGVSGRGMVTDGRSVLTLESGRGDATLTARDVATGATAWSAQVAVDDPVLALLPDGTVVAAGSRELVALRR